MTRQAAVHVFVAVCCLAAAADDPLAAKLTQADRDLFEQLFKDGLFDPKQAAWTKTVIEVPSQFPSAPPQRHERHDWKTGDRFVSCDGVRFTLDNVKETSPAKLTEPARHRLGPNRERRFGFGEAADPPDLAFAAWCYRIGEEAVAAELLAAVRKRLEATQRGRAQNPAGTGRLAAPTDPRGNLRWELAWIANARMAEAFQARQDELALGHGEILQTKLKEELARFPQASEVVADLKRRQREGTFGKPAAVPPADYPTWTADQKARWHVGQLDVRGRATSAPPPRSKATLMSRRSSSSATTPCLRCSTAWRKTRG